MFRTTTVLTVLCIATAGAAWAVNPTKDDESVHFTASGSNGGDIQPTGDGGNGDITVNPSATCQYKGTNDSFVACLKAGIEATQPYQLEQIESGDLAFAVNRDDGVDLPDFGFRENDPTIQTLDIRFDQENDMSLRIGGFEEHPSPGGGPIDVWINHMFVTRIDTIAYVDRIEVTDRLFNDLGNAGFEVERAAALPVYAIMVHADPYGGEIVHVKIQIQDPALITTDLEFVPARPTGPGI